MPREHGAMTELDLHGGRRASIAPTGPADRDELIALFRAIVAADEGYPQDPSDPVSDEAFTAYWLQPATITEVARIDGAMAGAYTMKPNNVGRAAHVANAGFIVDARFRGHGLGEAMVRHAMTAALDLGFDAMQFNFVFESNPARRLYERLGFEVVGRVPGVIDGGAVLIYWRSLVQPQR
jgi:ribosomal protein S18 acetylase RimI-like enzyme